MYLLESLVIAVSMYSKIPVPNIEWKEKNMKYAMCFFPVVGILLCVAEIFLGHFLLSSGAGRIFFSSVMTLFPLIVTGGIHMDGFMDTVDALGSCGDREKKLEILKDPHAGAFAILGLACYLIWSMALWSEVTRKMLPAIGCGYVLSRALSGLSVVTFSSASKSGLARTFKDMADKKKARTVMVIWAAAGSMALLFFGQVSGAAALLTASIVFIFYKRMCDRQFGGITGDLAGYFLQVCELAMLTIIVLVGRIL